MRFSAKIFVFSAVRNLITKRLFQLIKKGLGLNLLILQLKPSRFQRPKRFFHCFAPLPQKKAVANTTASVRNIFIKNPYLNEKVELPISFPSQKRSTL